MLIEVFIPTYNHEKFIKKALQNVVNQQTNHQYSIVISDDCSTDNTVKEIEHFIVSNKTNSITFLKQDKNVGIMENYYRYLNQTDADIILFCEGDDYWFDKSKLQKEVDFLKNNENCGVVFCAINNMEHQTEKILSVRGDVGKKGAYYLKDILPHNTLNTLSAVAIKNVLKHNYPKWYTQCNTPDGPLYFISLGDKYYIQYLDFIGTNYRSTGGIWSRLNKIEQQKSSIETYQILLKNMDDKVKKYCKQSILKSLLTLAKEYRKEDFSKSLNYCKKVISYPYFGWKKLVYIFALPLVLINIFD